MSKRLRNDKIDINEEEPRFHKFFKKVKRTKNELNLQKDLNNLQKRYKSVLRGAR